MSVMVLDVKTYEKITNSGYLLNKVFYGKNFSFDYLYELSKILYNLNVVSYNETYLDNENVDFVFDEKINKNSKEKFNNMFELLKSLQCVRYNINFDENSLKADSEEYNSLIFLEKVINRIKDYIIENMEEYKISKWG